MVFNSDLTVFNLVTDPVTRMDTLSRAYLPKCLYMASHGANIEKSGLADADAAKVYILLEWLTEADKLAVDPKNFQLPSAQFTLEPGCVIVKGFVPPGPTTLKELEATYDHVHTVTTVDVRDFGSPAMHHLEVGCK